MAFAIYAFAHSRLEAFAQKFKIKIVWIDEHF